MNHILSNAVISFARVLNITDMTGIARLACRCGFNDQGLLLRLNLNGLGIRGDIDISEFTKHLTVLDIRNNPGLGRVKISSLSSLAFCMDHPETDSSNEALRTDKGQTVLTSDPDHDTEESPFSRYFISDDPEAPVIAVSSEPLAYDLSSVVKDFTDADVSTDMDAFRAESETERTLYLNARIGYALTSRLQENLDRTCIRMRNKGLDQLRRLAGQFEQVGFIRQIIRDIRNGLTDDSSDEVINRVCTDKADSFWKEPIDDIILEDYLVGNVGDVPVNARNYGEDGADFIKSVTSKKTEDQLKARRIARDNHIAGAVYGRSVLRLQARKYEYLVDELKRSIDSIGENIKLLEYEITIRHKHPKI